MPSKKPAAKPAKKKAAKKTVARPPRKAAPKIPTMDVGDGVYYRSVEGRELNATVKEVSEKRGVLTLTTGGRKNVERTAIKHKSKVKPGTPCWYVD